MSNPWQYDYFIYSRPSGSRRFLLTNLFQGTVGVNKVYAPRYRECDLPTLKTLLDAAASAYTGAGFQLRRLDGKTVVYSTGKP